MIETTSIFVETKEEATTNDRWTATKCQRNVSEKDSKDSK
jgi:hypothetical protein